MQNLIKQLFKQKPLNEKKYTKLKFFLKVETKIDSLRKKNEITRACLTIHVFECSFLCMNCK